MNDEWRYISCIRMVSFFFFHCHVCFTKGYLEINAYDSYEWITFIYMQCFPKNKGFEIWNSPPNEVDPQQGDHRSSQQCTSIEVVSIWSDLLEKNTLQFFRGWYEKMFNDPCFLRFKLVINMFHSWPSWHLFFVGWVSAMPGFGAHVES